MYLKPTLKKICKKDLANLDKYINQVLAIYRVTPNLAKAETSFSFLSTTEIKTYHYIGFWNQCNNSRWPRFWTTQSRSPLISLRHYKENTRWEPLQDCPENHGHRATFFWNSWENGISSGDLDIGYFILSVKDITHTLKSRPQGKQGYVMSRI